jgi:hypothetical protein
MGVPAALLNDAVKDIDHFGDKSERGDRPARGIEALAGSEGQQPQTLFDMMACALPLVSLPSAPMTNVRTPFLAHFWKGARAEIPARFTGTLI